MIASTSHGSRFAALGRYLARGHGTDRAGEQGRERNTERVAWVAVRHLPTCDPEIAAKYMQAAAAVNVRVEKPVYHIALAFDPNDPVTPAIMRRAAERLLADLGLGEHQAVLVAHRDRAHPHVHLMVNRVHPRTGRAWNDAWDYRRIEASLRAQERALGVRVVEGRHASPQPALPEVQGRGGTDGFGRRPAELDDPDRRQNESRASGKSRPDDEVPGATSRGEIQQSLRTNESALIERARARVDVFRTSATWDDLSARLATYGLRVERKGQGLVVTDGVTTVKASRVARDCSLAQLEARLGFQYDHWVAARERGRVELSDRAPEHAAEDAQRGTTGTARAHPAGSRLTLPSREQEDTMATAVSPVPETPEVSRRRLDPEELGLLTRVLAHTERVLDDPHRVSPELARPLTDQPMSARFVAQRLEQYDQVLQASIDATVGREAFTRARDVLEDGVAAGRAAAAAEARFQDALALVYRDPAAARREFDKASAQVGFDSAADMLRRTPEMYGQLASTQVPERKMFTTVMRDDDRLARAGAELAADLAGRAAVARESAPTVEHIARFTDTMNRAEAVAVRREAELAQMPRADELARSVARGVARLDERAFAELKAALPLPRAELADTFRDATVQVLARESAGRLQHVREQVAERTGITLPGGKEPSQEQRGQAAALHAETTRAVLNGRELARALDVTAVAGVADSATRGVDAGKGALDKMGREANEFRASPRARGEAADRSGRLVHQAIQALTPEELQALTTAVRVGAQLAVGASVGVANLVAKDVATVQGAVRAGVHKALAAREVER